MDSSRMNVMHINSLLELPEDNPKFAEIRQIWIKPVLSSDKLHKMIQKEDLRYIRNVDICKKLLELGLNYTLPTHQIIDNSEDIDEKKKFIHEGETFSRDIIITDPVLRLLANRERPNMNKVLSTIIHIRIRDQKGFFVSSYIDFEDSLRKARAKAPNHINWEKVFMETNRIRPKTSHLSFYNWHTKKVFMNNTHNYEVVHDSDEGLIFKYLGDLKKLCVRRKSYKYSSPSFKRITCFSDIYGHVVLYDHTIHKKL